MRIIAFAGRSGSGKSTLALMLADILTRQGEVVTLDTVIQPVRELMHDDLGGSDCGPMARMAMQTICTNLRAKDPEHFIKELTVRHSLPNSRPGFLILSDLRLRYRNEVEFCAKHGVVWLVEGNHRPLFRVAAEHESEEQEPGHSDLVDRVVVNNRPLTWMRIKLCALVGQGCHIKREG